MKVHRTTRDIVSQMILKVKILFSLQEQAPPPSASSNFSRRINLLVARKHLMHNLLGVDTFFHSILMKSKFKHAFYLSATSNHIPTGIWAAAAPRGRADWQPRSARRVWQQQYLRERARTCRTHGGAGGEIAEISPFYVFDEMYEDMM